MRNYKLYALLGLLLSVFALQSCLKDDTEIFDKNPSERLQEAIANAKRVLMSSEQGWLLEMYPEGSQSYGGYAFTLRFDEEKVYARSELAGDNSYEESSYYKMTDDDGPVLSFDTYNSLIHYFATPSSGAYEAFGGEFEFVVLQATEELITLRGKKTNNRMYMRKLPESPESYLNKLSVVSDDFIVSGAKGQIGTSEVTVTIDLDYRQFEICVPGKTETESIELINTAFTLTDQGIRLYQPIEVEGKSISNFAYDAANSTLACLDEGATDIKLTAVFPKGYRKYGDFAGNYEFVYNNDLEDETDDEYEKRINVVLTPAGDGSTYLMSGLNPNYDITLRYNKASGTLSLLTQDVATHSSTGYRVVLCPWDAQAGYFTWTAGVGIMTVWNEDEEHPEYTWEDNGVWRDYVANSFLLQFFDGDSRVGSVNDADYLINGSYRIPFLVTLTKID